MYNSDFYCAFFGDMMRCYCLVSELRKLNWFDWLDIGYIYFDSFSGIFMIIVWLRTFYSDHLTDLINWKVNSDSRANGHRPSTTRALFVWLYWLNGTSWKMTTDSNPLPTCMQRINIPECRLSHLPLYARVMHSTGTQTPRHNAKITENFR